MSEHAVSKFYKTPDSKKTSTKHQDQDQKLTTTTSTSQKDTHGVKREATMVGLSSAPDKKKCHLTPEPLWRLFPRQQLAFDFSRKCYQDSAVFAFESEEFGKQGQRKYVVTTYYEFGQRYLAIKESRHFYEVVIEDCACRLYFDIEFKTELNPNASGVTLLETFIQYIWYQLYVKYGLSCDRTNILDLESSTPAKFSRHLIFHLPGAVFKNNIHAGHFVHYCCDQLRSFKAQADLQQAYDSHFPALVMTKRSKDVPQCPSATDLMSLFVAGNLNKQALICDEGVYTRNRNFRLYLSSKLGKEVSLLVSKENRFRSSYGEDSTMKKRSQKFNNLMDSLICNVSFETSSRVLEFTSPHKPKKKVSSAASSSAAERDSEAEAGYQQSPFPTVDTFIISTLIMGGVEGSIRRWTYFSQGKQIVYDIQYNRWCERIGRAHKSNNIMIVADLMRGVYYQKCHDPECKRANFRSSEKSLPVKCNPLSASNTETSEDLSSLLGDITAEEISQLEADTSYYTPPQGRDSDSSSGSSSVDELMLQALVDYESSVRRTDSASKDVSQMPESKDETVETKKIELGELVDFNMSVDELDSFCEDIENI